MSLGGLYHSSKEWRCLPVPTSYSVKHHPEPRRGELTAEGRRLVAGRLPVGVWSMGELKVSPEDEE